MSTVLIEPHHVASAIVAPFEAPEEVKVRQMKQVTLSIAICAELSAQEMLDTNRLPNRQGPVKKRGKGKDKRW